MGVRCVENLITFQLAVEFKIEVYRLVDRHHAKIDFKYESQLRSAVSDIEADLAEGFARNVPGEFFQFIRYARGSLEEARRRLRDGIDRHVFTDADCKEAFALGKRCAEAMERLQRSLQPFLRQRRGRADLIIRRTSHT